MEATNKLVKLISPVTILTKVKVILREDFPTNVNPFFKYHLMYNPLLLTNEITEIYVQCMSLNCTILGQHATLKIKSIPSLYSHDWSPQAICSPPPLFSLSCPGLTILVNLILVVGICIIVSVTTVSVLMCCIFI